MRGLSHVARRDFFSRSVDLENWGQRKVGVLAESVDSEVFDVGPNSSTFQVRPRPSLRGRDYCSFRKWSSYGSSSQNNYPAGSSPSSHNVSSPFELSHYPIEVRFGYFVFRVAGFLRDFDIQARI